MMKLKSSEEIRKIVDTYLAGLLKPEEKKKASEKISKKLHDASNNGKISKREASRITGDIIGEYSRSGMVVNAAAFQVIYAKIWEE